MKEEDADHHQCNVAENFAVLASSRKFSRCKSPSHFYTKRKLLLNFKETKSGTGGYEIL